MLVIFSLLSDLVLGGCRYDGQFFTSAEWDEADGHHFDGHVNVKFDGKVSEWVVTVEFNQQVTIVQKTGVSN